MVASPEEARRQAEAAGQQQQQQQPASQQIAGPGSGITSGRSAMPSTFEQFREMGSRVEPNPQDQAVLEDMRQRIEQRMGRAEDQRDTAKYDAILMAGLAMMGGNSMADGIARAAQTGGATYMASRQEANKAIDAAENAELAFRQYEISLRKGDEESARKQFKDYSDYVLELQKIDASYARTAAMSADTQTNRALGRVAQLDGAIDRARTNVANQPKYKIELDQLRKKMETGVITEQEQAQYNALLAKIDAEVATRTAPLQRQIDSLYSGLSGEGSIDGFDVLR
jgi:hypothetical protein